MLEIMQRGGEFMWIIFGVSVISFAVIIERAWVLWVRYYLNTDKFLTEIIGYLEERKISRAIEVCNVENGHPVTLVLKSGLLQANESDRDILRAMESASLKIAPQVGKRVNYLAMLANVATLLGLLGTIVGLIEAFRGVAQADAAAKQEILSKGIAVAMFTTAAGLIAAIPSIVFHSVLQNRQGEILSEVETKATDLYNYLSARNKREEKEA